MSEITVYTARSVITMDPSLPRGTAIAVRDGMILEVGTLDSLHPWLSKHPHKIDDRFIDHILMPGFIDPHLHPTMAAILLNMQFITAVEWRLPWQTVKPTTSKDGFLASARRTRRRNGRPGGALIHLGLSPIVARADSPSGFRRTRHHPSSRCLAPGPSTRSLSTAPCWHGWESMRKKPTHR